MKLDFMIGGAMKSGTSSLHTVLSRHERVFIPEGERKYFNIGDIDENRDAFFFDNKNWHILPPPGGSKTIDGWYEGCFKDQTGKLIGDDCAGLLTSSRGARQLRERFPGIKLIFLLRDPVERTIRIIGMT